MTAEEVVPEKKTRRSSKKISSATTSVEDGKDGQKSGDKVDPTSS